MIMFYDSTGQRTNRCNSWSSQGDEGHSEYTYNVRGEVKQIQHFESSNSMEYGMIYTRDGAGNPMAVDFSGYYCPTAYNGKTVSYAYDEMSRLTSEKVGTGNPTTWSYDWVGNRSQSFSYSYNQVDQLNSGSGYEYDPMGNLVYVPDSSDDDRTAYEYNDANLLKQVDKYASGQRSSRFLMYWDADGNRVKVQNNDSGRTWQFLYDPTASVPAALVSLDSGAAGPLYSIREPGGELLADYGGDVAGARSYYYDALGNAVFLTNYGYIYNGVAYGAWGDVVDSLNTPDTPDQFVGDPGYYTHDSSVQGSGLGSLMQLGVRFYDAGTGRFTQRDPVEGGLAAYLYAGGNPLQAVDPSGEIWFGGGFPYVHRGQRPGEKPDPGAEALKALGEWFRDAVLDRASENHEWIPLAAHVIDTLTKLNEKTREALKTCMEAAEEIHKSTLCIGSNYAVNVETCNDCAQAILDAAGAQNPGYIGAHYACLHMPE